MPDGYRDTLIYVESLEEVMADKIISLPATQKYVRHRDILDLMWLQQEGATINKELIEKKIIDYKIEEFMEMLDRRIHSIETIVNGADFEREMKRFLSQESYERTLGKKKFREFLISNLAGLLTSAKKELSANTNNEPAFRF